MLRTVYCHTFELIYFRSALRDLVSASYCRLHSCRKLTSVIRKHQSTPVKVYLSPFFLHLLPEKLSLPHSLLSLLSLDLSLSHSLTTPLSNSAFARLSLSLPFHILVLPIKIWARVANATQRLTSSASFSSSLTTSALLYASNNTRPSPSLFATLSTTYMLSKLLLIREFDPTKVIDEEKIFGF